MDKKEGTFLLVFFQGALSVIGKTTELSGLTGLVEGGVKNLISGKGTKWSNLFSIARDKVDMLIRYRSYLTEEQRKQIVNALQSGKGIARFRLTKQQQGGFLGTLLASIGVPLLLKTITGKGVKSKSIHVENRYPRNVL